MSDQKLSLCLHAGAVEVSRETLLDLRTPPAEGRWCPVPHHQLVGTLVGNLEAAGLSVVAETHAIKDDGLKYFGAIQVSGDSITDPTGGSAVVIGIRNSNDRSFAVSLALGSRVFICDNMAFSAAVVLGEKQNINLRRAHTKYVVRDLPRLVGDGVRQLVNLSAVQQQRFAAYRETAGDGSIALNLLVDALESDVLPSNLVPDLLREIRSPRHAEFRDGSLWSTFNCFTEVLKPAAKLEQRTQRLHGLCDKIAVAKGTLKLSAV